MNTIEPTVVVVTRNLPPIVGGMERLVGRIVESLSLKFRVHVIGPKGARQSLDRTVQISETIIRPLWWFLLTAFFMTVIRSIGLRPKYVVAGSGLVAPIAWAAARLCGARCVVYLHGLDVEAKNAVYRSLWRPVFKYFDQVLVNSAFTKSLALEAGVAEDRIHILHPGVEIPDYSKKPQASASFRMKHHLGAAPLMLYVGRITSRKGLLPFVQKALPQIADTSPDARLIVIGDEPKWAVKQESGQMAEIRKSLSAEGVSDRVLFLGEMRADSADLSAAYYAADVLIFPVQAVPGDNEGFGMVAIEAAAHGLPTIAFQAGGVSDAVGNGVSGYLIVSGDYGAFAERVIEMLSNGLPEEPIRSFAQQFSWSVFDEKLHTLLAQS